MVVQLLCSRGSVDGDSGGLSALLNNLCPLMDGEECIACPTIRAISEVLRNLSVEESKKALLRLKGLLMSEDAEVSCVAAHSIRCYVEQGHEAQAACVGLEIPVCLFNALCKAPEGSRYCLHISNALEVKPCEDAVFSM